MSALVAGGGLQDGAGGRRQHRPRRTAQGPAVYTPTNVLSTVYRALGIDPAQTFLNGSGRPVYILDEREPVKELI